MKKSCLAISITLVLVVILLALPLSLASPYAWPKATVTVHNVTAFPNITNALMDFTFYGVTHEATSSEPWITLNLSQELTADYNNTVIGTNFVNTVEPFYYDDNNYYIIGNVTDGSYERVYVEFGFNLSQHLMNKSQVSIYKISVGPFMAKCTINPDTNASFAIVNQSDMTILYSNLDLNSTSETGTTYHITGASVIDQVFNGTTDPAVKVILDFMDSTGTAFNLSIEEVRCTVYYYVNITVSDWTVQQIPSTVAVGSNVNVPFWQNLTLSTYNQGINATIKITPAHATTLSGHTAYVNGTQQTIAVSNGVVTLNITNLVGNSTALRFNVGKAPVIHSRAHARLNWFSDAPITTTGLQRQRCIQIRNPNSYAIENVTVITDVPNSTIVSVTTSPTKTVTITGGSTTLTLSNVAGGETVSVFITYSTAGGLKVTAYYSDGETPLQDATVKIKLYNIQMGSKTTGSDGKATFSGLPAGIYSVTITHNGETVYETDAVVNWNQITTLKATTSAELAAPAIALPENWWIIIAALIALALFAAGVYLLLYY